ncbi:hypothetical protein ABR737_28195 [Streptomyces sp. Edi2]|uniref:hypothetical protein n=1 Tax=Streptomyces sp. Edi2 TaxID=3162528 RepID=UPI00330564E6
MERFTELAGVPEGRLVVTVPENGNVASVTLGIQQARHSDLAAVLGTASLLWWPLSTDAEATMCSLCDVPIMPGCPPSG